MTLVGPPPLSPPQGTRDTHMVQHVDTVRALGRFPVVHDVGDEVIGGVGVCCLRLLRQVLPQVHVPVGCTRSTDTPQLGVTLTQTSE